MPNLLRFKFWGKGLLTLALVVTICLATGASQNGPRFNDLSHRLMCACGCSQLLGECNHLGCAESSRERQELSAAIASGASDKQILAGFASEYGATILAAPTAHGFDLVAWVAPVAVLLAGLLVTILVVRRWSIDATQPPSAPSPEMKALYERVRHEIESDTAGGY